MVTANPNAKPLAGQHILVTRPAHQSAGQCAEIERLGGTPVSLPLLEIIPTGESDAEFQLLKQAIIDLDHYQHVFFVSPNAARLGAELIDQYWPQLPVGINWLAIGAKTAQTLAQYGIDAYHPPGGFLSEDLLASPVLKNVRGERVLILRGNRGRTLMAETLSERGARVSLACLYRTQCPPHSQARLEKALYQPPLSAMLVTSSGGLEHLIQLCQKHQLTPPRHLPLVVPSQRIAADARVLGFTRPQVAQGPDDLSMVARLLP